VACRSEALSGWLRALLTECLRIGAFPDGWKTGRLVLIRKDGRPVESPSAYRPLCLLDEAGKIFERILAERLVEHLADVGPDLAEDQFGFRRGRGTIDAVGRVRSLAEPVLAGGGVCVAVSLDIVNAFNTLPLDAIRGRWFATRCPPTSRR
jgi:Reverse transcriptase (RNA-dependent DNA polymerase).